MNYLTIEQFQKQQGLSRRTIYYKIQRGELLATKINGVKYIVEEKSQTPEVKFNSETKDNIIQVKKAEYMDRIKSISIYIKNHGRNAKSQEMIQSILDEVKTLEGRGIKIKGFGQRNIQIMLKKHLDGITEIKRKMRKDKFTTKVKIAQERPELYDRAIDLISHFYIADPLHSLRNAIDRTRYESEKREEMWDIRAINFYTLRSWVNREFKASGMKNLHEYFNHRNIWRKKLAYVEGSFTRDIGFMDVYAVDDRKADVAGAWDWDAEKGEFVRKKVYMWTCCEAHTGKVLGFEMQARDFSEEDLIVLMMRVFKQHGLPNKKVIYDNGLMSGERCTQFFNRLHLESAGVIAEAQTAYSPTDKATIERIHKMMKEETDIYNKNFTGSNHPVEGRHEGVTLSPEETLALISEEKNRYTAYFEGYFLDRPRDLQIPGIEHLKDNTKRVSIRKVCEYLYQKHSKREVTDEQLCYSYMKYDEVKHFDNYFIKYQKELYLPAEPLSPAFNEPSYRYFVAYNPNNMNSIFLYTAQDIIDRITGALYNRGDLICRMDSISNLSIEEKKMKVAKYNKSIKKHTLELARSIRGRYAVNSDIANIVIDRDDEMVNVAKEQEREIAAMIKNAVPAERIEEMLNNAQEPVESDEAFSENMLQTLNDIEI